MKEEEGAAQVGEFMLPDSSAQVGTRHRMKIYCSFEFRFIESRNIILLI